MSMIAFDTLKLARKLEAGGFSAKQAESFAEAFADVVQDAPSMELLTELREEMATKKDLQDQVGAIRAEMATKKDLEQFATKKDLEQFATKKDLEQFATKKDLEVLRSQMTAEIFAAKNDMLKWGVAALGAQGALIVAFLKVLL